VASPSSSPFPSSPSQSPLILKSSNPSLISQPTVRLFEALAVYVCNATVKYVCLAIYRPVSRRVCSEFLTELSDVSECVATYAVPLIILDDINVHLDESDWTFTVAELAVNNILSDFNLKQHVNGPKHTLRHMLDFVITSKDAPTTVNVDPPNENAGLVLGFPFVPCKEADTSVVHTCIRFMTAILISSSAKVINCTSTTSSSPIMTIDHSMKTA